MIKIDIIKDALVFLFVYIPPFIIFVKFWRERHKGKVLLVLIGFLYIIISFFTQNLIPFIFVILNIKYLRSAANVEDVFQSQFIPLSDINHSKSSLSRKLHGDYNRFKFSLKSFNLIEGIKLTCISYLATIIISVVETILFSNFKVEAEQQEIVTWMTSMPLNKFLIMIPIVIIFAPVLEEFVFRWIFFQKTFRPRIGVYFAAILSSLIFAFIHFNLRAFPLLVWIGLYNCYLINKKGYWYSVFNHFVFNSVTTGILLMEKLGTIKF
ncbi:CPBP family intramembrane metalloprotease [Clostridiaceae bacterium UIB06]|nr:CPBP family intramembrane metalloprotease [Clostridiaceae bacterium UIB06]